MLGIIKKVIYRNTKDSNFILIIIKKINLHINILGVEFGINMINIQ